MLTRRMFNAGVLMFGFAPAARAGEPVRIGGTGAALGLLKRLAHSFAHHVPGHSVELFPGLGSSGALSALAQGALDIAFSGRKLNAKEQAFGLVAMGFAETPFAFVTRTVEPLSLSCLEIARIYSGELHSLPNGQLARLILRPRSDATTLFMTENIKGFREALEKARQRPDVPVAATDQENLELADSVPNSLTAMTLMQHSTEPNVLQPVTLDGVPPSLQAMRAETYPLKMQLALARPPKSSEAAETFMAFLATPAARAEIERAHAHCLL